MRRMAYGTTMVMALVVLGACGGGGSGGGGNNPVVTIGKAGAPNGDAQTGTVGSALVDSLRVVVNEDNLAKAGATVTWTSAATGAILSPTSSITDANGLAVARWTLGTGAGAQTARATLAGAGGSPVTFSATGTAGAAAALVKQAGDGQGEVVNTNFGLPLQVRVNDGFGNPVEGVTIQWAGSGAVHAVSAATNTNNLGIASVTAQALANGGTGTVVGSVSGVIGSVTFNLTVGNRKAFAGNFFFASAGNATRNPAIDTLAVNETMLWVNQAGGHTVESLGPPSFTSSGTLSVYTVTFGTAGSYEYDCGVHGTAMTGRVVVQ